MNWFSEELNALSQKGLRRELKERDTSILDFCSNDYLGLAHDPRLKRAAKRAIEKFGVGSGSARLISGNNPLYEKLETSLARWKGAESSLIFSSGYHANIGVIPAIVREGSVIFSDELNHASLIDGCRLS